MGVFVLRRAKSEFGRGWLLVQKQEASSVLPWDERCSGNPLVDYKDGVISCDDTRSCIGGTTRRLGELVIAKRVELE